MTKVPKFRDNLWKWLTLALITFVSIYVLQGGLRLGLDLNGGTQFTLGVDTAKLTESIKAAYPELADDEARINEMVERQLAGSDERIERVIRRRVDAMGTNEPVIQSANDHRMIVQLPGIDAAGREMARENLRRASFLEFRLTHPANFEKARQLLERDVAPEGYKKVGTEGYVRTSDWKTVSKTPGYDERLSRFQVMEVVKNPGYVFMLEKEDGIYKPNFVMRHTEPNVTGADLKHASVDIDHLSGKITIPFELTSEGGVKFARLTGDYMARGAKNPTSEGRQLAIVLDGELISAPRINARISSRGVIEGQFSTERAQQLANDLNAGALPAPMSILAESTVSPTVGQEAIRSGKIAAVLGFMLIAIFMFIYYWNTGLVADIALFLDVALLPTALVICANVLGVFAADPAMGGGGSMQLPVLTMPGIAGLVLSLGMAVDANVLIFERIREEFAAGRVAGKAIENGYGRAFTAIFDSNITTILTGIILFVVGTGPVRGFAIMLTAGVVISMFTAIVVTRLVLDHAVDPSRAKPFKMMQLFKTPNFNFMKFTKYTVGCSFAFILLALAIFAWRLNNNPASVLAVDLTGGTSIVYKIDDKANKPAVKDIRAALKDFDNAAVIQYQLGDAEGDLLIKTGETSETRNGLDIGKHILDTLNTAFPAAKFNKDYQIDEVGSVVGDDLRKSGTYAVIFSLIAILFYVGIRFEFGFGLGGIVALAHDALITLGIYSLCGRQVSLIVITALLTIIGYSINDTIVVFDRIREKLRQDAKTPFIDLCNLAINQCLSRTVITSVTTFFAVFALFAFGDGSIFDFAFTMLIGVIAGTYSSIFIATPIMIWWYRGKRPEFEAEKTDSAK